jgi:segregation and condensation protein A
MLLPHARRRPVEEEDPRAELVRRLREYERFKQAAEDIDALPRLERDTFSVTAEPPSATWCDRATVAAGDAVAQGCAGALAMFAHHQIQ